MEFTILGSEGDEAHTEDFTSLGAAIAWALEHFPEEPRWWCYDNAIPPEIIPDSYASEMLGQVTAVDLRPIWPDYMSPAESEALFIAEMGVAPIMDARPSFPWKDALLRRALAQLAPRGFGTSWKDSQQPFTELHADCSRLASDASFHGVLAPYLRMHTTLTRAMKMLLASMATVTSANWEHVATPSQGAAARRLFLGRWIPTFLIVDGPIGRFMQDQDSPLAPHYGRANPALTAARDFLREPTFNSIRNGFAHWSFDWEDVGDDSYVVAYGYDRDMPTVKLHLEEADAYSTCAYAIVEALYATMIAPSHSEAA